MRTLARIILAIIGVLLLLPGICGGYIFVGMTMANGIKYSPLMNLPIISIIIGIAGIALLVKVVNWKSK